MLAVTVKPQLLELISQYQNQVTVKSECFRIEEMPRGGRSVSRGSEKPPPEEKVKAVSEKGNPSQQKASGMMQKEKEMKKVKTGAEPVQAEPTAVASSSRASSVALDKQKKSALETEKAFRAAVDALHQCRQERELRDRVMQLHRLFRARETFQSNARTFKRMIARGEQGYSVSKQRAEEKRKVAYASCDNQSIEEVLKTAKDETVYDTEADDEADQLEIASKGRRTIRNVRIAIAGSRWRKGRNAQSSVGGREERHWTNWRPF